MLVSHSVACRLVTVFWDRYCYIKVQILQIIYHISITNNNYKILKIKTVKSKIFLSTNFGEGWG